MHQELEKAEQERDELRARVRELEENHIDAITDAHGEGQESVLVENARLREALGLYSPWPLLDTMERLMEATEHLLKVHSCDTHGHETFRRALAESRKLLPIARAALAPAEKEGE